MYFPLNMGIFYSYVSLTEANIYIYIYSFFLFFGFLLAWLLLAFWHLAKWSCLGAALDLPQTWNLKVGHSK